MRPAALIFVAIGFLLSVIAAGFVAHLAVIKLEDATLRVTKTALVASGQNWADVRTDGTLVYLSGIAPDEKKRIQAFDAIAGVVSVPRIRNTMEVEESIAARAPDFALEILRNGLDVSLIGITPREDIDIIRAAIEGIFGVTLIDMKETTTWDAPAGWPEALEYGAAIMARLERAKISILPAQVSVTAVVKSDADKILLTRTLTDLRPEGVELTMDITAPRPIFSPYNLTFNMTDADKTLRCHALSEIGINMILGAAKVDTGCAIGLGAPTDNWSEVAVMGIKAVQKMGAGTLEMQDSSITITAPEGFDPEIFTTITSTLQKGLPQAYLLRGILPQKQVIADDSRPFFDATRAAQGDVVLEGVAIDDISKRTVQTFSRAKFGFQSVSDNTHIASFAPHGWTARQLVAIEVLSLLNEGKIAVTEDTVVVTGKGQVLNLKSTILSMLESGFGADVHITINVEEIAPPPVELILPDTQECVDEIAALLLENPIMFAPSSAVIKLTSEKTIRQIAMILNRCQHAYFEIGGHTDSQGREEMNKNLSQNRADAVLDALLARNMLLGGIAAVGYGESQPIADNETEEGRLANRRIAFKFLENPPEILTEDGFTYVEIGPVRRPENLHIIIPQTPVEETDGSN